MLRRWRFDKPIQRYIGYHAIRYSSTELAEIGPLSSYQRKIESGAIKPNEEQAFAIVKLQKLTERLIKYKPPHVAPFPPPYRQSTIKNLFKSVHFLGDPTDSALVTVEIDRPNYPGPKGMWLHGQVGTGKTFMMDLFYDTLPIARKKRVHFHQFSVAVYSRIHVWEKSNLLEKDQHVTTVVARDLMDEAWLLCFDEFQVTDVATASVLKGVLSEMFRMGAVMITTSNRVPGDLVKGQYQKEFYRGFSDMLSDRCEVHEIRNTEDYRSLIQIESPLDEGEQVFYRKDLPKEDRAFSKRVTDLFYGKQEEPRELEIYGRKITINTHTKTTALFTFDELCGSRTAHVLGAPDYLRICQEFPCIILQNVPIMDLTQKNEARRFITFIDAAYENKVHLILSAFAHPTNLFQSLEITRDTPESLMHQEMLGELLSEKQNRAPHNPVSPADVGASQTTGRLALFTGEDEKFAFGRAVSRLNEMGSGVWVRSEHVAADVGREIRKELYNASNRVEERSDLAGRLEEIKANARIIANDELLQEALKSREVFLGTDRHFASEDIGQESTLAQSGDFADEAGYGGNVEMYDKYGYNQQHIAHTEKYVKKSAGMFSRVGDMLKTRDDKAPKFGDAHFFGMRTDWGVKAGNWGKGLSRFLNDIKESKEGAGRK